MEQSEQQIGGTGVELNSKQQPALHDTTNAHNNGLISMQPSYQSNTFITTPFTTTPSNTASSSSLQPPAKDDDLARKMRTLKVEDQRDLATTAAPPTDSGITSLPRRASLILASAASNAAEAAANVVTTARRLVLHDGGEEDLEDTAGVEKKDHSGLEFSQRHLSVKRNKKPLEDERTGAAAAATAAPVFDTSFPVNAATSFPGYTTTSDGAITSASAVAPVTVPAPAPVPTPASTLPSTMLRTTTNDFPGADVGAGICPSEPELNTTNNTIMPAAVSDPTAFSFAGMGRPENKALTAVQYPSGNRNPPRKTSPAFTESTYDAGNTRDNLTALSGADNRSMAAAYTAPMDDFPRPNRRPSSIRSMPIFGRRLSGGVKPDHAKPRSLLEEPLDPENNNMGTHKPLSTMYVAHRGTESSRSQAMNVDMPSVSHFVGSSTTRSGMGVDAPHFVGGPQDTHNARTGGLSVDGKISKAHPYDDGHPIHVPQDDPTWENAGGDVEWVAPIQTSRDPNQVIYGNVHHRTQNTLPDARAAISRNPFEAYMSHHRQSTSSGMGVDEPLIPTFNPAGSGSSDNTNLDRPAGIYNSAINVDRAGSPGNSRSSMGVDQAATSVHHMASADNLRMKYKKKMGDDTGSLHTTGSKTRADDDHSSIIDKMKNVFRSSSRETFESTNTETARVGAAATAGPVPTTTNAATPVAFEAPFNTDNNAHESMFAATSSSSAPSTTIPAEYNGPIPEAAPGEKVVWVKKTVKTDVYEGEGNNEGNGNPAEVQTNETHKKGHFSFIHRLRHHHHHHSSAEKGKRRHRS